MSKPNSTAKLFSMPEEHQAKLASWLLNNMPYHQARDLVFKEFGVQVKSLDSFSRFWQVVCEPALIAKRRRAAGLANNLAQEAQKNPGQFDAATIEAIRQKAFELSIAPGADPKDVQALFNLILKSKDQDADKEKLKLAERQLGLSEQKYRDVQEQKRKLEASLQKVSKGGITPETLREMEEAVKLL